MIPMLERKAESKVTTVVPGAGPTMPPSFDVEALALHSGIGKSSLLSETVLEIVPDLSWRGARLDLVETQILSQLDGISPLGLLEWTMEVSRDELYATLSTLLVRGFVRVLEEAAEAAPRSGVQLRAAPVEELVVDDGTLWASTG